MDRETFNFLLCRIEQGIIKEPTVMAPNPIELHRQLASTIYRTAHGCSFQVLKYIFGVSQLLSTQIFNKVIRVLISSFYDEFIKLPNNEEEWVQESIPFIENYKFPCVGAWDGFHVNITTHVNNHYSFNDKYTVTSMGLVGHNKRFLHLTTGAPGSTHDAGFLRHCSLFRTICSGGRIPNKSVSLTNAGEIPPINTGDGAFPRLPWLIKAFNDNTRDSKEKYFNKKLYSARVVTENAYGMLKECWQLTYKRC